MTLSNSTIATHTRTIPRIEVLAGGSITLTAVARAAHHVFTKRASLLNSRLQVLIRLLLDGLRVLKLLNQLHLDQLHLHDFLLFIGDQALLLFDLAGDVGSSLRDFSSARLLGLLLGHLLVELDAALALQVQPLHILQLLLLSCIVLLGL